MRGSSGPTPHCGCGIDCMALTTDEFHRFSDWIGISPLDHNMIFYRRFGGITFQLLHLPAFDFELILSVEYLVIQSNWHHPTRGLHAAQYCLFRSLRPSYE
jgi:hypothetical protein